MPCPAGGPAQPAAPRGHPRHRVSGHPRHRRDAIALGTAARLEARHRPGGALRSRHRLRQHLPQQQAQEEGRERAGLATCPRQRGLPALLDPDARTSSSARRTCRPRASGMASPSTWPATSARSGSPTTRRFREASSSSPATSPAKRLIALIESLKRQGYTAPRDRGPGLHPGEQLGPLAQRASRRAVPGN